MKTKQSIYIVAMIVFATIISKHLNAQNWLLGGNPTIGANGTNISNVFGTRSNTPINIQTNGITRAMWSTGAALSGAGSNGSGDGLRIFNPVSINNPAGNLDLWTANIFSTHIRFGNSGHIDGQNGRFEVHSTSGTLYYNSTNGAVPRHLFNVNQIEVGRMGLSASKSIKNPLS